MSSFETERLLMRPFTIMDAQDVFEMSSDPELHRYTGSEPVVSLPDQLIKLAKIIEYVDKRADGFGFWAIELKESGKVIGRSELIPLPVDSKVELGWHLNRSYWGEGFATESARGALKYAFEVQKTPAVNSLVFAENERSIAVTKRLGMTHLGTTSKYYGFTAEMYRIQKSEWKARGE